MKFELMIISPLFLAPLDGAVSHCKLHSELLSHPYKGEIELFPGDRTAILLFIYSKCIYTKLLSEWSSWNSHTLLVGMLNGTITLENSLFLVKLKHRLVM